MRDCLDTTLDPGDLAVVYTDRCRAYIGRVLEATEHHVTLGHQPKHLSAVMLENLVCAGWNVPAWVGAVTILRENINYARKTR